MIQVVILSPVPAMQAGLRSLIVEEEGFEVIGGWDAAGEGETGVLRVAIVAADVLETIEPGAAADHRSANAMPAGTMSTAGTIPPDAPVLLVQDGGEAAAITPLPAALTGRPGWGVISSEASGDALRAVVRAVAQGMVVLPPDRAQEMLAREAFGGGSGPRAPILSTADAEPVESLTAREGDVLRLLAQGLTNRQIAAALRISEHTVKFHVSAIYAKLRVSNRAEAVRTGARWGMVAL